MVHAYFCMFFPEFYVLGLKLNGYFYFTVAPKKEAVNYSETSIISFETIRCHNPEDRNRRDLGTNLCPWFRTSCFKKEFCILHLRSYKTDVWVQSDSMYDLSICGVGWTHASQRDTKDRPPRQSTISLIKTISPLYVKHFSARKYLSFPRLFWWMCGHSPSWYYYDKPLGGWRVISPWKIVRWVPCHRYRN